MDDFLSGFGAASVIWFAFFAYVMYENPRASKAWGVAFLFTGIGALVGIIQLFI